MERAFARLLDWIDIPSTSGEEGSYGDALARELVAGYNGPALGSPIGTFLDAVQAPSALIAACLSSELPVSHISSGREIPDDLEAADAPTLTSSLTRRAS